MLHHWHGRHDVHAGWHRPVSESYRRPDLQWSISVVSRQHWDSPHGHCRVFRQRAFRSYHIRLRFWECNRVFPDHFYILVFRCNTHSLLCRRLLCQAQHRNWVHRLGIRPREEDYLQRHTLRPAGSFAITAFGMPAHYPCLLGKPCLPSCVQYVIFLNCNQQQ